MEKRQSISQDAEIFPAVDDSTVRWSALWRMMKSGRGWEGEGVSLFLL